MFTFMSGFRSSLKTTLADDPLASGTTNVKWAWAAATANSPTTAAPSIRYMGSPPEVLKPSNTSREPRNTRNTRKERLNPGLRPALCGCAWFSFVSFVYFVVPPPGLPVGPHQDVGDFE